MSGAPVVDLQIAVQEPLSRATHPNDKHIACAARRGKSARGRRRAVAAIGCGLLLAAASAFAQAAAPGEVPHPEAPPVLVQPSPIGDLEYRAGRGLRIGDTGLNLGGFSTLLVEHEESGTTRFTLDDLNLLLLLDPTPYFHVFSELGFENLVEFGDEVKQPEPHDDVAVDRLYGDLELSDRLNLRFGKFFTPVGRWNEIPAEPLLWTNSRPLVTEGPFDEQVTGGMAWGSFFPRIGTVTYKLYGQFLQPLDPDPRIPPAHRSAGARLEWTSLASWGIGTSYFASSRGGRWNHVGGLDALWSGDRWELMSELLGGRGDPAGRRLFGFYVQAVRELVTTLWLVGRYEYFDPGGDAPPANLFDAGFSWRPSSYVVFDLDYLAADRVGGIDRSEQNLPGLRFSLSILF
jgi:hypothetical protein